MKCRYLHQKDFISQLLRSIAVSNESRACVLSRASACPITVFVYCSDCHVAFCLAIIMHSVWRRVPLGTNVISVIC